MERDACARTPDEPLETISINALRMERDASDLSPTISGRHFYQRAPHGARHTPDGRERICWIISINALRMERDSKVV